MRCMKTILVLIICVGVSSSLDTTESSGVWNYMKSFNPFRSGAKEAEVKDKCRMKCDQNGIRNSFILIKFMFFLMILKQCFLNSNHI